MDFIIAVKIDFQITQKFIEIFYRAKCFTLKFPAGGHLLVRLNFLQAYTVIDS